MSKIAKKIMKDEDWEDSDSYVEMIDRHLEPLIAEIAKLKKVIQDKCWRSVPTLDGYEADLCIYCHKFRSQGHADDCPAKERK